MLSYLVLSAATSAVCAEDLAQRTKAVVKQIIRKLPRDFDRRLPGERALEFPGEHRVITQKNDLGLRLHWQCGHEPISVIRRLIKHDAIEGFEGLKPSDVGELVEGCTVCHCGKFKKLPSEGPFILIWWWAVREVSIVLGPCRTLIVLAIDIH